MDTEELIEYALTYGITQAAQKYEVPKAEAHNILMEYGKSNGSIGTECPCQVAAKSGMTWMCFFCTGPDLPEQFRKALNS